MNQDSSWSVTRIDTLRTCPTYVTVFDDAGNEIWRNDRAFSELPFGEYQAEVMGLAIHERGRVVADATGVRFHSDIPSAIHSDEQPPF